MRNENTGRFAFFRQLLADGVTCMFGNPGSSEENLFDALRSPEFKDFRYYLALHEGPAVAIADAFARASPPMALNGDAFAWRRPALVQLHSYAGLANGLGMMYYARRGYTPMVVIAGEAGLRYEALDGQMAADLAAIARPFVKSDANGPCAWRVVDPGSLLRLLRRAIKTAATPPMGPVFLALPIGRAGSAEPRARRALVPGALVHHSRAGDDRRGRASLALRDASPDPDGRRHCRRWRASRADRGRRSCRRRRVGRQLFGSEHARLASAVRRLSRPHVRRRQQGDHQGGGRRARLRHDRAAGGVSFARKRVRRKR